MNEQDLILKKKIEKREKIDIILAYVLIVILVACIGIILYLKFIREEEPTFQEYVPKYISLNEISTLLNSSLLVNGYRNDGSTFSSNVSGSSLVVTYTNEDDVINLNIPTIGNELAITIPEDNTEIVTEIYKEITTIICKYYGNSENICRNVIDSINSDSSISGIRYVNNNSVYIDTTKSIDVTTEIVYDEVTKTSINNTNYTLNLLDTQISNISITESNINLIFSGAIERLTDDNSDISILVKLYDSEDNLLGENKEEFNQNNPLIEKDTFEITFILSDTLSLNSISEYSIEIVK